jgi:signal transduction histidine kinase
VDINLGRSLADLLEPCRSEILDVYLMSLKLDAGHLITQVEVRDQVLDHADEALTDVFTALHTGRAMGLQDGGLAVDIGRARAAGSVHPTESLCAAGLLYDAAAGVFARKLSGRPDMAESLPLTLRLLNRRILYGSSVASTSYMTLLLERVNTAHIDERRRISRELHDRVAYGANATYRSLELAEAYYDSDPNRAKEKIEAAKNSLVGTLETIREIMAGLRARIGQESLQVALDNYVKAAFPPKPLTNILVTGDETWMFPEAREELYLTLREAIRNVLKHARARTLDVRVHITSNEASCTVVDDGVGFDSGSSSTAPRHIGLLSMRERIELLQGELEIETGPDLGTRLHILVPLIGIQDVESTR